MNTPQLRLRELLERLVEAEVRFVLVGGLAMNIDGLPVRVCSLEHLLEMKRAGERPRDREDVEALEAAQERDQDRD